MKKTLDTKKYKYQLSASLICANPLDIRKDIVSLEEGGIDSIHFDVMDGNFVPRLGLYPELLKSVKSITKLPIHVHLMIDDPVMFTPVFAEFGASSILVHYESCKHVHYAINQINSFGIKSGIILNYSILL